MSYSIFVKDGTAQGVAKQRLIETIAGSEKRVINDPYACLLYTSPSPRDGLLSRMPSSA